MNNNHYLIKGSIIGLKKEFEEQYIILHKHTFPEVLQRIHSSNIRDYSIFLNNGILFSRFVYSGTDYEADSAEIANDSVTKEWWKLTEPMQQPLEYRKKNEWWAGIDSWYYTEISTSESGPYTRHAYTIPIPAGFDKQSPDSPLGDISFWGTTYNLRVLQIFKGQSDLFVYFETYKNADVSYLPEILSNALKSASKLEKMTEVFHTENNASSTTPRKVFVTGCFDLLHSGHIAFMQEAAAYGELFVSIGADENVYQLKGRYPVNTQEERKYMIDSLACVKKCMINSGWGYIDFKKELHEIKPDVFVVNEDGHTPAKQALCEETGIEYHVLKRVPHADLPVRSTTTLRTECTIPFRIDLAGGWLDQPYVSKYYPGAVLTISIEPTFEFNDRSGMSSSTRRKAIELWHSDIPHADPEHLARILFSFENPPGTQQISGSQDSLGIVYPGLNKLNYNGGYWPVKIDSVHDEDILTWIENNIYLVTLGPRRNSYSPLNNTNITVEGATLLSAAAEDCWKAILNKDIRQFGSAFRRSFEAQIAMFPNMVDADINRTIDHYKDKAWGWKLSGAGGGGYIILIADTPVEGAMKIKIRRKNNL